MARRLVLAVAGSGKTAHLIGQLDEVHRFLVIAYTNGNVNALRSRIVRRFGYFPKNITLISYFSFLYSICYKPFLKMARKTTGINFEPCSNVFARGVNRYIDSNGCLYSNRLARAIEEENITGEVIARLDKYFDKILIDEFQDISGHDFNFIGSLAPYRGAMIFVGDFFQYTFATSLDGNVNRSLHDNCEGYIERCRRAGIELDIDLLQRSYRCGPTVCAFVSDRLGIPIQSHRNDQTTVRLVTQREEALAIFHDDRVVKLYFKESHRYLGNSKNWGECKGDDHFESVCVVLNPGTMKAFDANRLRELAPMTRNKLYVACTRARQDLLFIPEDMFKDLKTA